MKTIAPTEVIAAGREQIAKILAGPPEDIADAFLTMLIANMTANAEAGVASGRQQAEADARRISGVDFASLAEDTWAKLIDMPSPATDDLSIAALASVFNRVAFAQRLICIATVMDEAARLERIIGSTPYTAAALDPIAGALKHVAEMMRRGAVPLVLAGSEP